jgi:hypothetical protein
VGDQIEQVLSAVRRWPEFAAEAGISEGHSRMLASEMPGLSW